MDATKMLIFDLSITLAEILGSNSSCIYIYSDMYNIYIYIYILYIYIYILYRYSLYIDIKADVKCNNASLVHWHNFFKYAPKIKSKQRCL